MADLRGNRHSRLAKGMLQIRLETSEEVEVLSTFAKMNLKEDLIRGIYSYGFKRPSSIQKRTIVPMIKRRNVLVQAQSGAGKTATFSIAMLQSINTELKDTQVLCLSSTREHAVQIKNVLSELGNYMNVQSYACIGDPNVEVDDKKLEFGQHIVSGYPEYIIDIITRDILRTNNIKTLVLDEADKLLNDQSRRINIYNIFRFLPCCTQVIIISATITPDIFAMTTKLMKNPITILEKRDELTIEGVEQLFVSILIEISKLDILCDHCSLSTRAVIFCNTKMKVDWLTEKMRESNFSVRSIHDDMSQIERDMILEEFHTSKTKVLITTDYLARDIDVHGVSLVVNYDLPNNRELYMQIIGRSGIFGPNGTALSFALYDPKTLEMIRKYYSK